MSRISVLESVTVGDSSISKEDHDLVESLGILSEVVPERIVVLEIRLRVTLLGVDEVGELGRVSEEAATRKKVRNA